MEDARSLTQAQWAGNEAGDTQAGDRSSARRSNPAGSRDSEDLMGAPLADGMGRPLGRWPLRFPIRDGLRP